MTSIVFYYSIFVMIRYKNQSIRSSFELFWNLDALKGSEISYFEIDFIQQNKIKKILLIKPKKCVLH